MTIQLFELATGQEFVSLPWPYSKVLAIGFSPDGTVLASGCEDSRALVWDLAASDLLHELKGHQGGVRALAFSPDSTILATGDDAGTLRLWDASNGDEVVRWEKDKSRITSLAFSPDGSLLVSATQDAKVRLWNVDEGMPIASLAGHTGSVEAVAFSPQGDTLATAGWDRIIRIWNVANRQRIQKITGHVGGVKSVLYSPDGKTVISGSGDRSITLWNVATGRKLRQLQGHRGVVLSLALAADGRTLASGSDDRTLRLWDTVTGQPGRTLQENRGTVNAIAISPDGQMLACVTTGFFSNILRPVGTFKPTLSPAERPIPTSDLENLWEDLAAEDIELASVAVRTLTAVPTATLRLLEEKLQPVQPIRAEHLAPFRRACLSGNAQEREVAREEFLRLGSLAESLLKDMLNQTTSEEQRAWIDGMLDEIHQAPQPPETVRDLRAVGILERIGTKPARQMLERLATGTPDALLTQEARTALKRMVSLVSILP